MGVQNFTTGNVLTASDINTYLSNSDGIGRNLVHNGAMQIAQRGTSTASITAAGYYTADRWSVNVVSLGTHTMSVENDAPTGSGLRKSLKMLVTTADASPAATDRFSVVQSIEGQNLQRIAKGTASAQQLTLSFWVKANVTGTYIAELYDNDNTRFVSASYTISASATWERKTITFPADTTGAFDNDNATSMQIVFHLAEGSDLTSGTLGTTWNTTSANRAVGQTNLAATINNYWQITGVQLEVGATAGPFEFEDYSQTLRKCQRYYYRLNAETTGIRLGVGYATSTTVAAVMGGFPVTMRVRPTAIETSGTANHFAIGYAATRATCSAIPSQNAASTSAWAALFTVASGLTAGQGVTGDSDATNGASAYLGWSADL